MKVRLVFAVLVAAVATSLVVLPGAVAAAPAQTPAAAPAVAGVNVPINFTSTLGSFIGNFNVTRFAVQNGQLVAIGNLTGTVTDATGAVVGTINQALTLPVAGTAATGSCQILDLVLGPLNLNLLGLVVHLDTVHLNITAQSGPGNLLGNLLCSVAHLLDNTGGGTTGGALNGIAALLNNILRNL
jgi:hypothetical protein